MRTLITSTNLIPALIFLFGICTFQANAQCETWENPSTSTSWGDFNDNFGGAPCEGETGCETYEITEFEVFASESYRINKFIKGGEYSFSMCNGPGAGSWVPEFTIIAPSGAIDAFGGGDGDSCTITWIASESGSYVIVINEQDSCGTQSNIDVDNGYPAITCLGNTPCPDYCDKWILPADGGWTDFNTEFGGAPCDEGSGCPIYEISDFEVFAAEAYEINNFQAGGEYVFSMCEGPGAGTWVPEFTIIAPSGEVDAFGAGDGDSCTISWTASETGTYLIVINEMGQCGGGDNTEVSNGYPAITCLANTMCDTTATATCVVGNIVSETLVVVCGDQDSVIIVIENAVSPETGGFAYGFSPGDGGTGGIESGFSITNSSPSTSFDNGIGGLLANNGLDNLQGEWIITPFVYTEAGNAANSLCELSDSTITVYFNPELIVKIVDAGDGSFSVTAEGGSPPYSIVEDLSNGVYTATVTDEMGCVMADSINIETSSVLNTKSIQNISITPNPTNGKLWVDFQLTGSSKVNVKLMDINGRLLEVKNFKSNAEKMLLDLENYSNGVYFINIETESESVIRKIILTK